MPTSPWLPISQPDTDEEYLVLGSYLPLERFTTIPRFLRYTRSIRAQLMRTGGLVGYSLRASFSTKEFWTLSAWTDEQALAAFVRADPHREIMAALADRMGETRFTRWRMTGRRLPPDWDEALRRLDDHGGRRSPGD